MFVVGNEDLFSSLRLKHDYVTRCKSRLETERYNFSYLQRNEEYSISKIFNYIPEKIRNLPRKQIQTTLKT